MKDGTEKMKLTYNNLFYLLNRLSNFLSLKLLNNFEIYHNNKDQILYNFYNVKTLVCAKRYGTSFLLYYLNLSAIAINLLKSEKVYKDD